MASFIYTLTLFLAITIQITYTDLTLSTGAFIRHKGKLHVVDEYLGLLLDFSHINIFNDQFVDLRDQLFQIRNSVNLPSCTMITPELNNNIISELTEELDNVITPTHTRSKRAWPAIMVSGLSALFGFSTQVQMLYLQNRLSDLVQTQKNLRIEYIETKVKLQETSTLVNLLQTDIDNLKHVIANLTHNVEMCFQSTQITNVLVNIKIDLERTLNDVRSYINSIIMVSDGKVTADILPLETLNRILYNDTYNQRVNTFFPSKSTHMYYPFLEAQLTTKGLLITLPLQASKTYEYYSFTPHPTCNENQSIILDTEQTELLVDLNTHSHFEVNIEVVQNCPSHFGLTICNHIYINVVEQQSDTCLYSLLNSKQSSPSCRFHSVSYRSLPLLTRIEDSTLIHNPNGMEFRILCHDNTTIKSQCDFIVHISCGLKTENLVVQPVPMKNVTVTRTFHKRYVNIPQNQILVNNSDTMTFLIILSVVTPVIIINLLLILCFLFNRKKLLRSRSTPKIVHKVAK